ncbi:uncharacterized protein Z519_09489 [Cladophialophora bantiana CBS 173.52]|uniref:Glycoside hydrolase family 32 protein n=1 Tax=Cladophialophora bantiana (strain ATCC 10958 / CBS 173.52 / CDC B-1940 / NIH 8579) TaxID=1442370 RepID=A0A0D2HA13_CLAB1|nr:uncharacterized protein Z519_09489 [Cladophialophora bantiana CBS 173.52]KIW90058.1 hypothetical protein Z519_09489 [Cladophialophora bantiana CBS 173.52]
MVSSSSIIYAALIGSSYAQSSKYGELSLPTGVPIPGTYSGALRPQVHFSPPREFMNDPSGMFIDANGMYHFTGAHATSNDLYHWVNQQIAIFLPDAHSNIYSGSAVVDVNNLSGFFPHQNNGVVAVYTINTPTSQTQALSYSIDGGYTFRPYSGNRVLSDNSSQFRDPKVIWNAPTQQWVMGVVYAQALTVGFFTSPNLKDWEREPIYLLTISINSGAPLGGSITQYFPGFFNGIIFTPVDGAARIGDFRQGQLCGPVLLRHPRRPRSNIHFLDQQLTVLAAGAYRTLGGLARVGYDLVSVPYSLSLVINTTSSLVQKTMVGNSSVRLDYSSFASGALYFQINITDILTANISGTANFTFLSSRGNTRGFDNLFFTDKFSTGCPYNSSASSYTWRVEGVIDRSILEVFINGGESSATVTFFPEQALDTLAISAGDLNPGVAVWAVVHGLDSAWATFEDVDGTVLGNVHRAQVTEIRRGIPTRF